jgi:hypothetical protein
MPLLARRQQREAFDHFLGAKVIPSMFFENRCIPATDFMQFCYSAARVLATLSPSLEHDALDLCIHNLRFGNTWRIRWA